jgi:hypothetical protein
MGTVAHRRLPDATVRSKNMPFYVLIVFTIPIVGLLSISYQGWRASNKLSCPWHPGPIPVMTVCYRYAALIFPKLHIFYDT